MAADAARKVIDRPPFVGDCYRHERRFWTEDGRHILQPPQEIRGIAARPGIGLAAIL